MRYTNKQRQALRKMAAALNRLSESEVDFNEANQEDLFGRLCNIAGHMPMTDGYGKAMELMRDCERAYEDARVSRRIAEHKEEGAK